ncbi:MAG: radical SAM protein [Candidatus Aenigmarchaeota archaeon]|nr:radical SAM protein [Candidatus Aenigmarchaeota archaeon]
MRVTLINPNIVTQKGDFFSSGVPYMPVSLAYLAGVLMKKNDVQIIDAFGEAPQKMHVKGDYFIQGLTIQEILSKVKNDTEHFFTYAGQVVSHTVHLDIIKALRKQFPATPITVVENTQSVVAYALTKVAEDFFSAGATYIITGEAEPCAELLLTGTTPEKIDGLVFRKNNQIIRNKKISYLSSEELDKLPFPAWELFPVQNYWKLGYAHGPLTEKRYLSILTSRGCGLLCNFCVVPETNEGKWRSRSAKNVVDEIEHWVKMFDVHEFHIQDLNPTTYKGRIAEMSRIILERKLHVNWKFVAGTKIETLDKETITLAAKAGCSYVSLSPESGSPRVLKLMKKSFVHKYGLEMVRHMHNLGVTSQACFVLGFPGETDEDLEMSVDYCKQLAKTGVDELALFIMTPIPGSATYGTSGLTNFERLDQLTFSPTWRSDYCKLQRLRWKIYTRFFFWKLIHHPIKLLKQPFHVLSGRFHTKMEQTVFHAIKLWWMSRTAKQL